MEINKIYHCKFIAHGINDSVANCLNKLIQEDKFQYADIDFQVKETLRQADLKDVPSIIRMLKNLEVNDREAVSVQMINALKRHCAVDPMHINRKTVGDIYGPRTHSMDEILVRPGRDIKITRNERKFYVRSSEDSVELFQNRSCQNIPSDIWEDELIFIFESCGFIRNFTLPLNCATQRNRGYAMIEFTTDIEANNAILKLNNFDIRRGIRLKVFKASTKTNFIIIRSKSNPYEILKNLNPPDGVTGFGIYQDRLLAPTLNYLSLQLKPAPTKFFGLVTYENPYYSVDDLPRVAGGLSCHGEVYGEHHCLKTNLTFQCPCVHERLNRISVLKEEIDLAESSCSNDIIQRARDECFIRYARHTLAMEEVTYQKGDLNGINNMSNYGLQLLQRRQLGVQELHSLHLTLNACDGDRNGRFRNSTEIAQTFFYGKWLTYQNPAQITKEIEKILGLFCEYVGWTDTISSSNKILAAAIISTMFLGTHPYTDGNGRLSRLLFNLILQTDNYPWITFPITHTTEYIEALNCAHKSQDFSLIVTFASKMIEESLFNYKSMLV